MAVKLQGIAEYLNGIGVKLPGQEEEAPAATTEPDTSNTEVVQ